MITLSIESLNREEIRHDPAHLNDTIELIQAITGSTHCVINGVDYRLSQGDLCIINRGRTHSNYCDGNRCTFLRLLIDPVLFQSYETVYHQYLVPILNDQTFAHVKIGKVEAADISHLMNRMKELNEAAFAGYELEMVAMVYLLFQRLYVLYQKEKGKTLTRPNTDLLIYQRMLHFITQSYQEKIALTDIAASGNISKSKCGAIFKKYAGHTPICFLNLYRLKISTELLDATDKSIADLASSCGFDQQSYYNRLFLREYGMTPKEYRERNRGGSRETAPMDS